MKKLTLKLLIVVAATVAYPGSFLIAYLTGDTGVKGALSASLLGGSINFVIFVATGGIVFRKRISASIQGTAAGDGPLQTEGSSGPLAEPGPPNEGGSPSKEPVVSSAL